jgi:hypothetical protein
MGTINKLFSSSTTNKKVVTQMATNFVIEISGKNGIFRTENKLTIFQQHVTENRLKDELQDIKKCIKQMNKSGEITIDIAESVNYSYNYQFQ